MTLRFAVPLRAAEEVNLVEDVDPRLLGSGALSLDGDTLRLDFRPFEIKTLRLVF